MMKNIPWFLCGKGLLLAVLAAGLAGHAVAAGYDAGPLSEYDGTSVSITIYPNPKPRLDYQVATSREVLVFPSVTLIATPSYYPDYLFTLNKTQVYEGPDSRITVSKPLYYNKRTNYASVLVTDEHGCVGMDSTQFRLDVTLPNVFQPGSGYNELFMKGLNVKIFNREGHVLYKGTSGWDGRYKGKDMPAGTYFYELLYPNEDNTMEVYTGAVLLERVK